MTKLETLRKAAGMRREDLAALAGISQQTLYLYETRKPGKAGIPIQRALAMALKCTPDVIFKDGRAR